MRPSHLAMQQDETTLAAAELDDDQKRDVIGAMVKRDVVAGEIILRWGRPCLEDATICVSACACGCSWW